MSVKTGHAQAEQAGPRVERETHVLVDHVLRSFIRQRDESRELLRPTRRVASGERAVSRRSGRV
jgi:hypothetical protein